MTRLKDLHNGWIKTPAAWFQTDSPKERRMYAMLQWLIMNANLTDGEWRGMPVKRGQIVTSLSTLCEALQQSQQQTRNTLKNIEENKEITKRGTKTATIITICNYDDYVGINLDKNKDNNKEATKPTTKVGTKKQQSEEQWYKDIIRDKDIIVNPVVSPTARARVEDDGTAVSKTWKNDFGIYQAECAQAYKTFCADENWIATRERYNPGVDIRLTLEKVYSEYWSTEIGWKKKKTSKAMQIDWGRTFINSISIKANRVYKQKGTQNPMRELQTTRIYEKW